MSWYADYLEARDEIELIQDASPTIQDYVVAILHNLELLKKECDQETKEEILKQISFWEASKS